MELLTLHPRRRGRWSGRWTDASGSTVYGTWDPATGNTRLVDPAADAKLPALARWLREGRLVAYRPTRRAVVELPDSFVKILRPARVEPLLERHQAVEQARRDGFPVTADVLDASPEEGWIRLARVHGHTLHGLLRTRSPDLSDALARIAASLACWHAVDVPDDLPPVSGRSMPQWLEAVAPLLGDDARTEYEHTIADLPARPEGGVARLVHGDLHDGNVLVDGERVGILDLDSLGRGHPAQDVGNLAAHLVLRSLQDKRGAAPGRARAQALVEAYSASGGTGGRLDADAARRRALARLACVYAARPRWRHLCPALLREASLSG